jgi:hypothetical protein
VLACGRSDLLLAAARPSEMGNQQGGPAGGRFTLRGLSWRPPQRSTYNEGGPALPAGLGIAEDSNPWDVRKTSASAASVAASVRKEPTAQQSMPRQSTLGGGQSMRQMSTLGQSMRQSAMPAVSVRDSVASGVSTTWSRVSDPASKGPEFKELYDRLVEFYGKHDPEALREKEIDISGMASWCLESEDGSIELLNEKLMDRFGERLEDKPAARAARGGSFVQRSTMQSSRGAAQSTMTSKAKSSAAAAEEEEEWEARAPPRDNEEEEDEEEEGKSGSDDEDSERLQEQTRGELERFFLQFGPSGLADIDEYMDEFKQHGRIALNVKLFRMYGKNLTSLNAAAAERGNGVVPETMGRASPKGSPLLRKVSKLGVQLGSADMLSEMSGAAAVRESRKPSDAFQQKRTTIDQSSNVNASLQRKWNHLKNRNLGLSTRISTKIASRFAAKPAPVEAPPLVSSADSPSRFTPTPFSGAASAVSTGFTFIPKPRGMRGTVKEFGPTSSSAKPLVLKTGGQSAVVPQSAAPTKRPIVEPPSAKDDEHDEPEEPEEQADELEPHESSTRSKVSEALVRSESRTLARKRACDKFVLNLQGEFATCSTCGCKKDVHGAPRKPQLAATLQRKWSNVANN